MPFSRVLAIISQLFKAIALSKCVLTILELHWKQSFRDKKTKLNICHNMLTSSAQLQNRSFHVVERTKTPARCPKCTGEACKAIVFLCQVWKFVTFLFPSSSWFLKPNAASIGYLTYNLTYYNLTSFE